MATIRISGGRQRPGPLARPAKAREREQEMETDRCAILVVDDEPAIRMLLVDILRLEGFRAESVADGELALRILDDDPEIRLVLTDMVMAGMGGPEIIEHVLSRRPELKLVGMSGTPQDEKVRRLLENNRIPFIIK